MTVRARGASLAVLGKTETTSGTAATGNFAQLPVFSFELSEVQPLQQDNVLSTSAGRDAADPFYDAINVAGNVRIPIDLENTGHWLYMLLGAATVTGTTDFTHTWTSGLESLPSKTFEKGLTDVDQYFLYTYAKANSFNIDFSPSGAADATINLMAQSETIAGTTGGGTPTYAGMTRFRRSQGAITKGGSALAHVMGGNFTYSNNLEGIRVIRADNKLEAIEEGQATLGGQLKLRFSDATFINDAIAGTPRALAFSYTISATKSLTFTMPRVFFSQDGLPVTGPNGVDQNVNFLAARDSTAGYMLQVVLKNQTAAYT